MLQQTNRQLWEIVNEATDIQEAMEAVCLLEERGDRSAKLFKKKAKLIGKREKEIQRDEQKSNVLLPKIAAFFFVLSSFLAVVGFVILLLRHDYGYLFENLKFIFIGVFLLVIRALMIIRVTGGVAWAKHVLLYTFLMLYGLIFSIGYPDVFRFVFIDNLLFGIIFLTHLLTETLALFLVYKAFRK